MEPAALSALEALRRFAVGYHQAAFSFAAWMDLPNTEGIALGEIMWAENAGTPLSPGRLSQRVGLTSGATNALINRLERRDLVHRSRESTDGRVVTLRATERARRAAAPHLDRSRAALDAATAQADPRTLAAVERFVDDILDVMPKPSSSLPSSRTDAG